MDDIPHWVEILWMFAAFIIGAVLGALQGVSFLYFIKSKKYTKIVPNLKNLAPIFSQGIVFLIVRVIDLPDDLVVKFVPILWISFGILLAIPVASVLVKRLLDEWKNGSYDPPKPRSFQK